jgi:hypothetical protein
LAAVISGALLIGSWWAVPVAGGLLLLAALSYRGSVAAAGAYGALINAAVDLHRFDLLRALHLPLPVNPPAELVANRALMQFLRHRVPMSDMDYQHPSV